MSYSYGLGQTGSSLVTLAAHSPGIYAIQNALIQAGVLHIRTADGVIGAGSQTLAAIQAWAPAHGFSATGTTRTASGGLVIHQDLYTAIVAAPATGTPPGPGPGPAPTGPAPTGPGSTADVGKPAGGSASSYTPPSTGGGKDGAPITGAAFPAGVSSGTTNWMPWAIGGAAAIVGLGLLVAVSRR